MNVYFIPGQGADSRLFSKINLDKGLEMKHIEHPVPSEGMSLEKYALLLAEQIDTTQEYSIVGTSIGGMLATELYYLLKPSKTIIISSAKGRDELPLRYRIQKKIPLYKLITPRIAKKGALIMQPIVERDRNNEKEVFVSMLEEKNSLTLQRQITMIMNWERKSSPSDIYHIHGEKDKTIPLRNVLANKVLKSGSHMISLTRAEEISDILNEVLLEEKS